MLLLSQGTAFEYFTFQIRRLKGLVSRYCIAFDTDSTLTFWVHAVLFAAKNVWKKRFFDEKRKTQPLEEQVNRLRYEVDIQHKALMAFLDKKGKLGFLHGCSKPA